MSLPLVTALPLLQGVAFVPNASMARRFNGGEQDGLGAVRSSVRKPVDAVINWWEPLGAGSKWVRRVGAQRSPPRAAACAPASPSLAAAEAITLWNPCGGMKAPAGSRIMLSAAACTVAKGDAVPA